MQYGTLQADVRVGKAKTAVIIHAPRRSLLLLGLTRCEECGERWGRDGCGRFREAVALLIAHAARSNAAGLRRLLADLPTPDQPKRGSRPTGHPRRSRRQRRSLAHLGGGLYKTGIAA